MKMDFQQTSQLNSSLADHNYWISCEPPTANVPISELMHPFDDVILDFMTEQDIPGASIALSRDGKLLYCQGYGSAGAGRKVQPNFMFRIASISKTITAVGIMRLVEEGKISLEDRVFGPQAKVVAYGRVAYKRWLLSRSQTTGCLSIESYEPVVISTYSTY